MGVEPPKLPGFKFKPRQVNYFPQSNQGTDHLVSHHPSSEMIPEPTYLFDVVLPCWCSFVITKTLQLKHSSFWLPHVIRSGMITKHSPVIQSILLVPFSTQKIPSLQLS
jgi:hypothetical protein